MSVYQQLARFGSRLFPPAVVFRVGFNLSPMYRRTTGKILSVSDDLKHIVVSLPLSWKNRNYVNSIFGGAMFSAVDPIPMVQLINLLGDQYIVWDKSATIRFKRPATEDLVAEFVVRDEELDLIRAQVRETGEMEIVRTTDLTSLDRSRVFCRVQKTLYIADKAYYKQKRAQRSGSRP